ncbi:sensor domain-containing diguanylate cyclase [Hyphomicrobium sulfonivorans]|uniref:GGDEF domain-containing protein n=1 Tax=Hyphomicrobium sulfonivorans TaxID=121290 RepID=UPI00156EF0B9|nr:GGDEF domain-containing protein [Hyphomicrobium sulfonivorans]MBI1649168.1 GGDEF domain-containing protein [Hyphomicrobium sulfonivorans]NSL70301.1 hypothetical protein [Hyphomicrobium sulfonivorans]
MQLDLQTISIVSCAATFMIGAILLAIWWHDRNSALIGWWGLSQLVLGIGLGMAACGAAMKLPALVAFAQALIIMGTAIMWMAVREFNGRTFNALLVAAWPVAYVMIAALFVISFDQRLILTSATIAALLLLTASEFARPGQDPSSSRWVAMLLLCFTAASYLIWLPLTVSLPILATGGGETSAWFPAALLLAMLTRIALAFVILFIAQEQQERRQHTFARTDALTGLPNRRALFEAANRLRQAVRRKKTATATSVMILDLDHFKRINDNYGHRVGDNVLQYFARTLVSTLDEDTIVGRLGGEEFAAILPNTPIEVAQAEAERVRVAFANSGAFIGGIPVGSTVSIGVASHIGTDYDLSALFHRADGALYAAKQAGRNRVECAGILSQDEAALDSRWLEEQHPLTAQSTRRFRGSAA